MGLPPRAAPLAKARQPVERPALGFGLRLQAAHRRQVIQPPKAMGLHLHIRIGIGQIPDSDIGLFNHHTAKDELPSHQLLAARIQPDRNYQQCAALPAK